MLHIISRLHHESKHSVCRCTSHNTLTPPVWGVGLCFSLPEDAGLSMCWCLRHRISNWTWALYQSHHPPYSTTCLSWSTAHSPPELVAGRFSSLPWPTRCTPDTVPPPDPSPPPCPGRGPAESAPVGQPLPCWWRSGKASQTSADPQALKRHRNKLQKEISVNLGGCECHRGTFYLQPVRSWPGGSPTPGCSVLWPWQLPHRSLEHLSSLVRLGNKAKSTRLGSILDCYCRPVWKTQLIDIICFCLHCFHMTSTKFTQVEAQLLNLCNSQSLNMINRKQCFKEYTNERVKKNNNNNNNSPLWKFQRGITS